MTVVKKQPAGNLWQIFGSNPLRTSVWVWVVLAVITITAGLLYYRDNYERYLALLLAQMHGLILDVAVIGILIFWLFRKGEKNRNIRQYKEEIDDFRTWESEEAAFKTVGNIKRLNRLRIYSIDLSHCYLARTNLNHTRLEEANLNYANCSHAFLIDVNLEGARLNQTNFENSNLNQSFFTGSYAGGAIFRDAYLIKTDFRKTSLIRVNFENAYLMEADLRGADLTEANFINSNLYKADLRGAAGLSTDQLIKAKTLYLAKLDDDVHRELQDTYPELIGK